VIRLLLPFAGILTFFVLSLTTVRLVKPSQPRLFFLLYAILLLPIAGWTYTAIWPLGRIEDAAGLAACLLLQMLLCLTFWNGFYSLLWGFSGGLVYDLYTDDRLRDVNRLIQSYEGDGETDRMMARRLPNLAKGGYLRLEDDTMRLLPKGRFIALGTLASFKFFSLGMGGGVK
jgi:hypothetical protein